MNTGTLQYTGTAETSTNTFTFDASIKCDACHEDTLHINLKGFCLSCYRQYVRLKESLQGRMEWLVATALMGGDEEEGWEFAQILRDLKK